MAETCIVCLGDLVPQDRTPPPTELTLNSPSLPGREGSVDNSESNFSCDSWATHESSKDKNLVAHLLPCGHNLHNDCLKPWVERANSCPICRASFNMVELSARVGGPKLSEYAVQDRQQVADLDLSMIVEDDLEFEDDGSYDACMVCDEFGDGSQLMYCLSCKNLWHVFCAGLDRMPMRGPWFCADCTNDPGLMQIAAPLQFSTRSPAAWVNGRSLVPRDHQPPDEWVGVWQSVWDRLQYDLEFPFEDDEPSDNHSEVLRRDIHLWERRFELARQAGAGNRFQAATDNICRWPEASQSARPANQALHCEAPNPPRDPESQEELRAWNQFEKAREQLEQQDVFPAPSVTSTSSRRGRKRKSANSSPVEPEPREQQPERKLKRPRTRLNIDNGESSGTGARRNTANNLAPLAALSSPPTATPGEAIAPGFLQSLLKEVVVDRYAERDRETVAPKPRHVIVERACSPQHSSPGLSPIYQKPPVMTSLPPLNLGRPGLPAQQNQQNSPTYSPYSPYSPAGHDRPGFGGVTYHSGGLSSPPRSKDSSPSRSTLSYSTKAELQRMVTTVLKPIYAKKEVTKDEYTEINRDVSRLLYSQVGEAGANALADRETREKWQQVATIQVENALKTMRANRAAELSPIAKDFTPAY